MVSFVGNLVATCLLAAPVNAERGAVEALDFWA